MASEMLSAPRARKRYCVFGCTELGAYMHSFPHPEKHSELFDTWVSIVGEKLKEMDRWRIFKNKKVCDYHFTADQKVASHRLIHNAVPTINLTGVVLSAAVSVQLEHNYCHPGPSPSTSANTVFTVPSATTLESITGTPFSEGSTSKTNINEGHKSAEHFMKKYRCAKKELRNLKAQCKKMKKKELNYRARLAKVQDILNGPDVLNRVTKNMTLSGKIFTKMQYRQALKNPKGRRYNTEEKILALTIYKKSPKCYALLEKYFKLPCAKSLKNLLRDIKIKPGINKVIFEKIKETVAGFSKEDCLCTLIFDEMSITPHVQYDIKSDEFKGFISGTHKEMKLANHVLVFMIKGIKSNYKQPVAYFFTQSLKTEEMKEIIREVVTHVSNSGLKILCTVCDQGATNVSAINSFIKDTKEKYLKKGCEWRQDFFEIAGNKIIPIFDVPHLIKGLRNNLLSKDLIYKDKDGTEKMVKWKYFEMLYEADKSCGELRYLHKLTEEHIKVDKIKKMRVKMAVQVFSHSVAVTTDHLTARNILPEECRQLIPFVLLIDKLFDSLNAGTFHIPNGKIYRGAVKRNSPHHELWREAIPFLKNLRFVTKKKEGNKIRLIESSVPSVRNLIKAIEGMQAIWKIVNQNYSLDLMLTRNLNQDPIENFFGNIRSIGVRNVSPNCHTFEGAFKTVLLNNFSCKQAVNTNCEEDFNVCLETLEFFLKEKENIREKLVEKKDIELNDYLFQAISNVSATPTYTGRYVCGWVLTKCMNKIIKKCQICRKALISTNPNDGNRYIRAKEYDKTKQWLCYPSNGLSNCFNEIQDITCTVLKTSLAISNLKGNIKLLCDIFATYPFTCAEHKENLKDFFTDTSVNILILSWCRTVNRILAGKITNNDPDDTIKSRAQMYYNTHHIKNKK